MGSVKLSLSMVEIVNIIQCIEKKVLSEKGNPVSMKQLHLISLIKANPDIIMSGLAQKLGVSDGTLTTAINACVNKGLLYRKQSQIDKRVYSLHLTDKGEEIARLNSKIHAQIRKSVENLLTDEEIKTANQSSELILWALKQGR